MKRQSKKAAFEAANLKSVLSVSADSKTIKGQSKGYLTGILYLSPADLLHNELGLKGTLCPSADIAGCKAGCLNSAGRGAFNSVQNGRKRRTKSFLFNQEAFLVALWHDINSLIAKAKKQGLTPCVRLNGTSDIDYTRLEFKAPNGMFCTIFDHFPDLQFYDYTKNVKLWRKRFYKMPSNYHLTLSYSEANKDYAEMIKNDIVVFDLGAAVVFSGDLPQEYKGIPVIDGDKTDLRFLDNSPYDIGFIVGLKAKGQAKKDKTSGFVIQSKKAA